MTPHRIVAGIVMLMLVATACAGGDGTAGPTESPALAGFRAHPERTGSGMDAIVSGIVEIDPDTGCVWLTESQGTRHPVLWPLGTDASSDPPTITLAGGQIVRSGDRVEGGGGYVDAAAAEGVGLAPFPPDCVQIGEAAVFNATSDIIVTAGEGLEQSETLVARFSPPQPIGFELIATNPNARSIAVVDFVTGTVHRFAPGQYAALEDAVAGISGGGGFIHVWADGTVHSYPGRIDAEPVVYEPETLRRTPGIAPTLRVLPAPDGERTWLVQAGVNGEPTLIELINLVEEQVARLMTTEITGSWQPVGATTEGLVIVTDDPEPTTALVSSDGSVTAEVSGIALSVGWNGAAIVRPDASLIVTDAGLQNPIEIEKPGNGEWVSVGGPTIPGDAPPLPTGTDRFLVQLAADPDRGTVFEGPLVLIDGAGRAVPIYELFEGSHLATWSRGSDWVVVVEDNSVTLVDVTDGMSLPLGPLVPDEHWVLSAG